MKQQVKQLLNDSMTTSPYHPVWASLVIFLLLFLAACNATTATVAPIGTSTEEDAIEQFLAAAPSISKQNTVLPTPLPKRESGLAMPVVNPAQLLGDITIAGNDNLFPLTDKLYRRFVADGYPGFLKMEEVGVKGSIQALCHSDPAQPPADIAAITRLLLDDELDRCLRQGQLPVAFWVGLDALVVVVHGKNDFVQDVSMAEVTDLFKMRRWSDVNPAWPRRDVIKVLPNPSTTAVDLFADVFFAGDRQLLLTIQNAFFTQDEVEAVQEILDHPDTIGLIDYTSYLQHKDMLRLVKIAGKTPDLATMQQGDWPLSRPLLFYTTAELLQSKAQLRGFLTYYLTHLDEEIIQVGKFPLTRFDLDHSKLNLLVATANDAWLADLRENQTATSANK